MSSKAKIYLYKEGNECTSLTGGYKTIVESSDAKLTLNRNSDNIEIISNFKHVVLITQNLINIIDELYLDLSTTRLSSSSDGRFGYRLNDSISYSSGVTYLVEKESINRCIIKTEQINLSKYVSFYCHTSHSGQSFKTNIYNIYYKTKENIISINSQNTSSINFSCNNLDNLISITKAEVYINNKLSKAYNDNFDNITYNIDKNLCSIGANNIKIKVTYSQGDDIYETVEEVLTHTNTVNNLSTSSSLKELIDRQELLTNSIEVQKNTLKSILESKNVEVSERENKLSILIQKVNELGESRTLWLYKEGVFNPLYEKVEMTEASPINYQSTYFELKNKGDNGNDTICRLSIKNIDFTNYTNLKIECDANVSATSPYANFTINIAPKELLEPNQSNAILSDISYTNFSKGIRSINVANVNGVYHLNLTIYFSSLKTYKIWLEK